MTDAEMRERQMLTRSFVAWWNAEMKKRPVVCDQDIWDAAYRLGHKAGLEAAARLPGDLPCSHCGKPTNSLAGNPGLWRVDLHYNGNGKNMPWHQQCVSEVLRGFATLTGSKYEI